MAKKKRDKIIESVVGTALAGITINVMDISKVYAFAERAQADGFSNDSLYKATREFAESIKV